MGWITGSADLAQTSSSSCVLSSIHSSIHLVDGCSSQPGLFPPHEITPPRVPTCRRLTIRCDATPPGFTTTSPPQRGYWRVPVASHVAPQCSLILLVSVSVLLGTCLGRCKARRISRPSVPPIGPDTRSPALPHACSWSEPLNARATTTHIHLTGPELSCIAPHLFSTCKKAHDGVRFRPAPRPPACSDSHASLGPAADHGPTRRPTANRPQSRQTASS